MPLRRWSAAIRTAALEVELNEARQKKAEAEAEDREITTFWRRENAEDEKLAGLLREDPYRELAEALRIMDADEEEIYKALLALADRRHEDYGEVFGVLYGSGRVKGPSEGF